MVNTDDVVQAAEQALRDAEEAFRAEPSEANQRRIVRASTEVREVPRDSVLEGIGAARARQVMINPSGDN